MTFVTRDRRGIVTAPSPRPVRSAVGGPSDDGVGFDRERGCGTRCLWRDPTMVSPRSRSARSKRLLRRAAIPFI